MRAATIHQKAMIDETSAKRARNEKRVARLAEANLGIADVLSAAKFMQMSNLKADPTFDEALGVAKSIAREFPGVAVCDVFEAGLILLETGWHDDATVKDAVDMARRITANVRIGNTALLDPDHKLYAPHPKDDVIVEAEQFLAEHGKTR